MRASPSRNGSRDRRLAVASRTERELGGGGGVSGEGGETQKGRIRIAAMCTYTVEPQNNGQIGDKCCLEVVPSSEVEMYGQL